MQKTSNRIKKRPEKAPQCPGSGSYKYYTYSQTRRT